MDDSEITATNNLISAVVTLMSPPLPTLPEDVIPEILCRLPVKLILQLRCVCKSWNSLISDSKFIKKHLHMSTRRRLHFLRILNCPENNYILASYPLDSFFTNLTTEFTEFEYPPNSFNRDYSFHHFSGSCNGILCFADHHKGLVILWNPSIRKFKELPLFTKPNGSIYLHMTFGFGYDSSTDIYKVVVVLDYDYFKPGSITSVKKVEVKVHTLGTDIWRSIQQYPFDGVPDRSPRSGKFVSGTINWLVSNERFFGKPNFIVSFDLVNESYQKILPHIGGEDMCDLWSIAVLRDCLCVTSGDDVWIMKEYGNKESWTKLFTVPYMREPTKYHVAIKPIYINEDDQVILEFIGDYDMNSALYDSKSGTLKPTIFQYYIPEVCVESLISPYSLC
ncbi:F-box/kelch-repeat protein At3g23880-like [Trifolium pratense]|nr:F-box/kelch-repeat protein At3g23880-like [Trifolium pratense]